MTIEGQIRSVHDLGPLPELYFPNTIPSGQNFGETFATHAAVITGEVTLDGVVSESDFYQVTVHEGDLLNLEIYSNIDRIPNPIDGVLRVFNAETGQILGYYNDLLGLGAFNDDSPDSRDPLIFDLPVDDGDLIPDEELMLVIEVDTFHFNLPELPIYLPDFDPQCGSGGECPDVDEGQYELFIYHSKPAATGTSSGDDLGGGDGDDLIIISSGLDNITDDSLLRPLPTLFAAEGASFVLPLLANDVEPALLDVLLVEPVPGADFPTGIAVDPTDGTLRWAPSDDGVFQVRITAIGEDPGGLTVTSRQNIGTLRLECRSRSRRGLGRSRCRLNGRGGHRVARGGEPFRSWSPRWRGWH